MRTDPRPPKRPDLNTALIVEAYKAGKSATALARRYKASVWSIISRLQKAGIEVRSSKEQNGHYLTVPEDKYHEFLGLLDGLLLGDASISKMGSLKLTQANVRYGWLTYVAAQLLEFGVRSKIVPVNRIPRPSYIEGHLLVSQESSVLVTPNYDCFKKQRTRWYPEGV